MRTNLFSCNRTGGRGFLARCSARLCWLVFGIAGAGVATAQVSAVWTQAYYPAGRYTRTADVIVDAAGNSYVIGGSVETAGAPYCQTDLIVLKYDPAGALLWKATYNPNHSKSIARSAAVDADGNLYVTGELGTTPYPDCDRAIYTDAVTFKFDPNGNVLWARQHDGASHTWDYGIRITLDSLGNAYVLGETKDVGDRTDILTIKYDASGNQQWLRTYYSNSTEAIPPNSLAKSIALDAAGNVYVGGWTRNDTASGGGIVTAVVKYANDGSPQWELRYPAYAGIFGMVLDASANIFVLRFDSGWVEAVKFDSNGTFQWRNNAVMPIGIRNVDNLWGADHFTAMTATGHLYHANGFWSNDPTKQGYSLARLDASTGTVLWVSDYDNADVVRPDDYRGGFEAMAADAQDNAYLTGSLVRDVPPPLLPAADFITVKYDASGALQWMQSYAGVGMCQDYAEAIAVDRPGIVVVAGDACTGTTSTSPGFSSGIVTIKYAEPPVDHIFADGFGS